MINKDSLHYRYDPSSIGWLHRRAEDGEEILNSDVARIVEADPALVPDPVLRHYVLRGLAGELKARRGRKRGTARMLRDLYIVALYDDLLPRLQARAERRKKKGIRKGRADYSPAEHAQALIAKRVGMATPEGVRNLISSHNNPKKFR